MDWRSFFLQIDLMNSLTGIRRQLIAVAYMGKDGSWIVNHYSSRYGKDADTICPYLTHVFFHSTCGTQLFVGGYCLNELLSNPRPRFVREKIVGRLETLLLVLECTLKYFLLKKSFGTPHGVDNHRNYPAVTISARNFLFVRQSWYYSRSFCEWFYNVTICDIARRRPCVFVSPCVERVRVFVVYTAWFWLYIPCGFFLT